MEIASVFTSKLMTFVRNVEFLGMTLKTRVQEVIDTGTDSVGSIAS